MGIMTSVGKPPSTGSGREIVRRKSDGCGGVFSLRFCRKKINMGAGIFGEVGAEFADAEVDGEADLLGCVADGVEIATSSAVALEAVEDVEGTGAFHLLGADGGLNVSIVADSTEEVGGDLEEGIGVTHIFIILRGRLWGLRRCA